MTDRNLLFQTAEGMPITMLQLEGIIEAAVAKAVTDHCRFPLSDEQANESNHLYGMYSDLGDSDLSKGIETARKNHSFIKALRAKSDRFSTYLFMIIIAAIAGGMMKTLWEGIKSFLSK